MPSKNPFLSDPAYVAKKDTYKLIGIRRGLCHLLYNTPDYSFPAISKQPHNSSQFFLIADVTAWLAATDIPKITTELEAQHAAITATEPNKGLALEHARLALFSAVKKAMPTATPGKTKTVHLYECQGEETRGISIDPYSGDMPHTVYINPTTRWL
ncbi:hypothetical protein KFZ76_11975 [Methylovulum psychrotolerans]|uniref:hypothetical protein n=1 Tax=Methylovulum psychrotolerans TaxID=1704499 RepID=UPI001BFEF971|nr:hypothetical protein [Methylovulum psychrotolerans]MBT9098425.1 hypothetical protein [Methylovulum psychrotolerans]